MHRLLAKQLKQAVTPDGSFDAAGLIELVDLAYEDADRDRRRTDRSINLMIDENRQLNAELLKRFDDLKLQNALFEDAIGNMVHGLSMFDHDNRLMVANKRYAEMYSLPASIVVPGVHLVDLVKYAVKAGVFEDATVIQGTIDTLKAMAHEKSLDRAWRVASGRTIAFTINVLDGGRWLAVHKDITDEHIAKRNLIESEQRFRDFTSVASDWCWETDKDHKFTFFTDAMEGFTSVAPREMLGKSRRDLPVHEDDRSIIEAHMKDLSEHKPFKDLMFRMHNSFNRQIWIKTSGLPRFDKKGQFIGYRGTGTDITKEQKRLEEIKAAKAILHERTSQLVEAQQLGKIGDWSYRLGATDLWWAPEIYNLLGYDPTKFKTTRDAVMSVYVADGANHVLESQSQVLRTGTTQSVDVKAKRCDGSIGDFVVTSKAIVGEGGNAIGFFGTIQDISERKQAEEQLEQLAYYDPLTGLANRALFRREVDDAVKHWRETGATGAILLLDLDRFKEINDSLGHASGDEVLVKVGHLFSRVLGTDHFLYRLGGDEFAVVVRDCGARDSIEKLATKLIEAISDPIKMDRGEVNIGTSVGVVLVANGCVESVQLISSNELLRCADLALYRAKESGRNCFKFFQHTMSEVVQKRVSLAHDLRLALTENKGLEAHFQPQVELATGRVTGFEALMRWNHPTRGYVPPSEFIPISESSRLICDLGLWILRKSVMQAKAWLDAGEPPREVAVNVSAAQIWYTDLHHDIARVLEETGLPPSLLCLELTESLFADHAGAKVQIALNSLKGLGVQLALDDFGTGYSSLGYLTKMPFSKLKIDRIFVDGVDELQSKRKLLAGIVALGQGLGMTIIAEGAEKPEEVAVLSGLGCELVQGYVFAKPSNAEEALVFARGFELESGIKALLAYSKAAADIKSIIKLAPSTAA